MLDMHFADGTHRRDPAQRLHDADGQGHPSGGRPLPPGPPDAGSRGSSPAPATPGLPGTAAYENANFPGDETTDWDRASGLASLTTDMLNRAVGGAYGYAHRHRRLLRLHLRPDDQGAVPPLGRVGRSQPGLPAARQRPRRDAHAVVVRRARRSASTKHSRACTCAPGRCSPSSGSGPTGPAYRRPGRCGWSTRDDRNGWHQDQEWLLGPNLLVAPIVTRARPHARSTSRAAAGSCTARAHRVRGHRTRHGRGRPGHAAVVHPLRHRAAGLRLCDLPPAI